ncbi:MAG: hypothetical protein ACYS7Y_36265 [Planctomycetota bacterium]
MQQLEIIFSNLDEFCEAVNVWYRRGLELEIKQGRGGNWIVTIISARF